MLFLSSLFALWSFAAADGIKEHGTDCPLEPAPVCGVNDLTYTNECIATQQVRTGSAPASEGNRRPDITSYVSWLRFLFGTIYTI